MMRVAVRYLRRLFFFLPKTAMYRWPWETGERAVDFLQNHSGETFTAGGAGRCADGFIGSGGAVVILCYQQLTPKGVSW